MDFMIQFLAVVGVYAILFGLFSIAAHIYKVYREVYKREEIENQSEKAIRDIFGDDIEIVWMYSPENYTFLGVTILLKKNNILK